jgi:hypothetical protein
VVVTLVVLFLLLPVNRGKFEALYDHARGVHRVKYYYCHSLGYETLALKKLSDHYGVDVEHVGNGINNWADADYWEGYNSVSIWLVERRFGKVVWQECFREAKEEFEQLHQNE